MNRMRRLGTNALLATLAAFFIAMPAEAQKKAKDKEKDRARSAEVRRQGETHRPDLIRRTDRGWEIDQRQARSQGNGPAFCRNGQGHPVHGRQWCRDKGWGLGTTSPVYDRRDTNDRRHRTFQEAHEAFHREHDRQCRLRAAERPLDPAWQLRVRNECRAEHDRWHERNDPNWRRS